NGDSWGECIPIVSVPDVSNITEDQAKTAIEDSELTVGKTIQEYHSTITEGYVIRLEPAWGTQVKKGSSVNIVVSLGPETVIVPNVANMPVEAAKNLIESKGLIATTSYEYSDNVSPGNIIRQNPLAGYEVAKGSSVNIVVSQGTEMVSVPDVSGIPEDRAKADIREAGLTVGKVQRENSDAIPEGNVISQVPIAKTQAPKGSPVNLIISEGPEMVTVPDVSNNMTEIQAKNAIENAELSVGTTISEPHSDVKEGYVIRLEPASGTQVQKGSPVDVVVSSGSEMVTVPDVSNNMTEAQAENAIENAELSVGTTISEHHSDVEEGYVIRLEPASGTRVQKGSPVDVIVSSGPEMFTVPDVSNNMTEAQAENAIENAELSVGTTISEPHSDVEEGYVIRLEPASGTRVQKGSPVDVIVSSGPEMVTVPDVSNNMTEAQAENAIENAELSVGTTISEPHSTVEEGYVIRLELASGTRVQKESSVDVVVSSGPEMVRVPDVTNMTEGEAKTAIRDVGLIVGVIEQDNDDFIPLGKVISQYPVAEERIQKGSPVNLVVSVGPAPVDVPNVIGLHWYEAENKIVTAGLAVGKISEQYHENVPLDFVINQNPTSGASVPKWSSVNLVISLGPELVTVPNVIGRKYNNAKFDLNKVGLEAEKFERVIDPSVPPDTVIKQDPVSGTLVKKGTIVKLTVSKPF
ncbi:MAG: PASTA domain-containing protein, partial [Bacteroidetes bacterium]|nr:PASTA domain-containing protein [Bacteroidota bacterium]